MGGSDPTGLTKWVIDALVDYPIEATITINLVLGPAFGEDAYLLEIIEGSDNKFAIHRDVPNMAEMMFHADFAISSGGMTAYELMATGTPAIIVPSTDVELKVAKAFEHVGAALCISCWDHCGTWKLQEAITMILESSQKMTKISNRGPEIIDGRGRKRVASIIVKEIESES
jgi:spore coat polysaccharide biosynthesis predicted glycosyltransferase SpsG